MKRKVTKKAISMALAAAMALAPVQAFASSNDISGHWAENTIISWQEKGLISGYEDGTFKPNNSVTRAEFILMLNKALGLTEKGEVNFSDVKEGSWFYDAVAVAVKAGYCFGYTDGTFKPNATITRAEASVMIALAKGLDKNESAADKFSDATNIPVWAKGYVGAVVGAGYMSGRPDNTFDPAKTITRAEAVSSLDRAISIKEESKDVVVTKDDTVIEGQTIEGNLIIDKAVGDGEVYVKDTTVKGDIIVKGGGDDSIYLTNVVAKGKVSMEKENVRLQVSGKTELPNIEIKAVCNITQKDFDGTVGTITLASNIGTSDTVTINVPAKALEISSKASITINSNVEKVTINKDGEGSKLSISSSAKVGTVVADGKVAISGSGKIEKLQANVDGITVSGSTTVTNTEVANGVSKPTTGSSSSGGGGGSSSSTTTKVTGVKITNAPSKIKPNDKVTLKADVTGTGSYNKNVEWSVEGGKATKIDKATGELTVGDEDEATKLVVTATSVGDNTKKATAEITVESSKAISITLDKTEATLTKGSEVTFVATVKDQYEQVMEGQNITWTMKNGADEYNNENVTLVDGKLTVGADANLADVTSITVEAKVDGIENPAIATVTLKNEEATVGKVVLTPQTADVKKGDTQKFTAEVQTAEGAVISGKTVTWSVEGKGEESSTQINEGTLTVAADETSAKLVVKATVTDGEIFGEATVNVLEASKVTSVEITSSHSEVEQGAVDVEFTGRVLDQYGKEMAEEAITWEATRSDEKEIKAGTTFGGDNKLTVAADEETGTLTITAKSATSGDIAVSTTVKVVDPAAEAKEAIKKLAELKSVEVENGHDNQSDVETAIKAAASKLVGAEYTVEATTADSYSTPNWKGTITIKETANEKNTATTAEMTITVTEKEETVVVEGSATVGDITVSGTAESAISETDVTITLANDTFNGQIDAETDVASWFKNLPSGLTAKVKTQVDSGANTVTIKIAGTPAEAKTEAMSIEIPLDKLTGGKAITVTTNENAKFEIAEKPVVVEGSATVGDITVSGTAESAISETDVTITLANDTFNGQIDAETDVASWFKNLPSGLTAKVKTQVDSGANTVTIKIAGTPAEAKTEAMSIEIPLDKLTGGKAITVTTNENAKFEIAEKPVVVEGSATVGDITVSGTAESAISETDVTITLANDTFNGQIDAETDVASWFKNLPSGLTAKVKTQVDSGANTVTIKIAGTPAEAKTEAMSIEIPLDKLTGGKAITVTSNENAKFEIAAKPVVVEGSATVGNVTVSGTAESAISETDVTITLANDTFNGQIDAETDVASWFKNLPSGLTAKVKTQVDSGANTVTIKIAGTPAEAKTEAMSIEIPLDKLTGGKAITVTTNENAKFEIAAKPVVASATASGTITGTNGTAFASEQKVTIDLTNDTFKAEAFTSGSSDTIDDAKSWVTNLSDIDAGTDAVTVKAVKKTNTQVELVFEGTPDTASTAQIAITIPSSVLTKDAQVVITPSESAKFAVAEKVDVTAENPEAIEGKVGEELNSKSATITITGANSSASITTDNITIDDQTGSTGSTKNGITAKVGTADLNGTVKIDLTGTPSAKEATKFIVKIPASAITAEEGYVAKELTATVTVNIAEAEKVEGSATVGNVTVSGTAESAISETDVTITLANDTFNGQIDAETDVASWFKNLPSGLTAKVKTQVDSGANTVTIKIAGTPAEAKTEAMSIEIPLDKLTGGKAITVTTNENAKFEIAAKPVVASATASGTITGTNGTAFASEQKVTIDLTNDTFKAEAFTSGSSDTIDDAKSWVTNLSDIDAGTDAVTVKAVKKTNTQVELVFEGTPDTASTAQIAITIPSSVLTKDAQVVITPSESAKFAVAEKVDVTAENPEAIEGKVGEELNSKSATITITGANSSASITTDNITIDDQTGSTGSTKNGITAKVGTADLNGTVKIDLTGTPSAKEATKFIVKIPASAITAEEGYVAKELTATVTVNIAEAEKVEGSATVGNVTVSGTAESAISETDVTITLANDTFNGQIDAETDVASWFKNLPSGLTAKVKTQVDSGANTVTIKIAGTPAEAKTEAMSIEIPLDKLTGGKAITVTTNENAKFEIAAKPVVASATASGTITGTNGTAFASEQKVTIDLTNDTFKAEAFTSGSSDTIDDAKSWVTNLSDIDAGTDAVTVKAVKKTNTQVELVFEGTPDTASTAQIAITIPSSVLTKDAQVVITPSESAKFAVAEKVDVTAENPEAIEGKVGEELNSKSATITITGANSSASITTDNITIDDQTGSTGSTKNGITAKVVAADSNGTVKISLEGTPDAAAASAPQTFTVKIPAGAITADKGYAAKELSVTVTVNVAKAEISEAKVKGLVAPVKDATPVAKETLSIAGNDNISVESIAWTTTDDSSPVVGNFGATTTYTATITLKAKDGYKFASGATSKVYSISEDDLNSSIVVDNGISAQVGGTDNDTLTITVKFNATLEA